MSITIRPFQPSDVEAMCTLHKRAIYEVCAKDYAADLISVWAATRMPQNYLNAQAKGSTFLIAANEEDIPVGFSSFHTNELCGLYVNPDYHRKGIATQLVTAIEAAALAAGTPLTYVESTLTAQKFYERHGYVKSGTGFSSIRGKETHIPYIAMRK